MTPTSTIPKILDALRQLPEADRLRILQFTLGILESRQGKRQQRRSRFQQKPIDDSWRVGH